VERGVADAIHRAIARSGSITFARFMDLALYHPQLGYYIRTARLGAAGDYYTSPELHPAFAWLIAGQAVAVWEQLGRPRPFQFVEVGGGSGLFARDFLRSAASAPAFAAALDYRIDEPSAGLQALQRERLEQAGFAERVNWSSGRAGDWYPDSVHGLILANELLDALPVHLVTRLEGELLELYVVERNGQLRLEPGSVSTPALPRYFKALGLDPPEGGQAEVNLNATRWVQRAARSLRAGILLLIDYGYPAAELYSASRRAGTLLCYREHRVTSDPLAHPGERDITSHVDLTSVRRSAVGGGLSPIGCWTQSQALSRAGLDRWASALAQLPLRGPELDANRRALEALIDPDGLGRLAWLAFAAGEDLASIEFPLRVPLPEPLPLQGPDHLRLLAESAMDPIPDVEQQWRELFAP